MSTQHEDDELVPTNTPGYKPGQDKSIDELAKLDAEDESLARWKASLGIVPGVGGAASGPKVTVLSLDLVSPTLPAGSKLSMNIQDKAALESMKPFNIKEGVPYNVRMVLKVNHGITSGIRYIQVVKRAGVTVDKMEQMLGSYSVKSGENQDGIIIKNFPEEDSPSGMIARSGTYNVKSRVVDDDGHIYAEWAWQFKLSKDW